MLAIPNFSEGTHPDRIDAIGRALRSIAGVSLLDVHSDPDHDRSVYTLADPAAVVAVTGQLASDSAERPAPLVDALLAGAACAIELLDIAQHHGSHPRIGMLDVAPVVYMSDADRGAACAQALTLGDRLGNELEIPVFLYGVLTEGRVTRAQIRRGGPQNMQARIDAGELRPDFGPRRLHRARGRCWSPPARR